MPKGSIRKRRQSRKGESSVWSRGIKFSVETLSRKNKHHYPYVPEKVILSQSQEMKRQLRVSFRFLGLSTREVCPPSLEEEYIGEDWWPESCFTDEEPEYDEATKMIDHFSDIKIGEPFDIISLLKTFGSDTLERRLLRKKIGIVPMEPSLRHKYVMVCCFSIPMMWNDDYVVYVRDVISICSELYSNRHDFVMLIVPKLKKGFKFPENVGRESEYGARLHALLSELFHSFLLSFPVDCLAVSLLDTKARDLICYSLGLNDGEPQCLVLDPEQNVLLRTGASFLHFHGADCFPFTDKEVMEFFPCIRSSPPSNLTGLDELLGFDVSGLLLRKREGPNQDAFIPMSTLKGKVVGLYMCSSGHLIPKLYKVYCQCRERGLDFEVVLVYIPFDKLFGPDKFVEMVEAQLQIWQISWCIMPFVDSISRRLLRFFNCCLDEGEEWLIMVGPDGKIDPYGASILTRDGIEGYPFTREKSLQKLEHAANALRLESLLVHGSYDYLLAKDESGAVRQVPVTKLRNRNVLLYVDKDVVEECRSDYMFDRVTKFYQDMREKDPKLEVVCVSLDARGGLQPAASLVTLSGFPETKWLLRPYDPEYTKHVRKQIVGQLPGLFAFGEDGEIRSVSAHKRLDSQGCDAFPFKLDLREELISLFADDWGWFFMRTPF